MAKTTIDDIAREAGCSRATVYRAFPGGKQAVLDATGQAEVARLMAGLADALDRTTSLDELLVVGLSSAVGAVRAHEALQYLLVHEPGHVLTHLAFDALDPLLALATDFARPYLERHLPPETAARTAEWLTRLIVSYSIEPDDTDLSDPVQARRLVETYLLPGLQPDLRTPTPVPPAAPVPA